MKGAHRWITTRRDRESKKYKRLHAALAAEVYGARLPWYLADMWK